MEQTAIDRLIDEGLVPLVEAVEQSGVPLEPLTALRAAKEGVRGVRLEVVDLGDGLRTSAAAVRRYAAARAETDARRREERDERRRQRSARPARRPGGAA